MNTAGVLHESCLRRFDRQPLAATLLFAQAAVCAAVDRAGPRPWPRGRLGRGRSCSSSTLRGMLANVPRCPPERRTAHNAGSGSNAVVSLSVAVAIGLALTSGMGAAIGVFGVWAMAAASPAGGGDTALADVRWPVGDDPEWRSIRPGGRILREAGDSRRPLDVSSVTPYVASVPATSGSRRLGSR